MVASFSTPQQVLDARDTDLQYAVWIGGVLTRTLTADGGQDVDRVVSTCTIELELPRPAWVVPNAEVEVQAGHNDLVGTVFSGFVPEWSGSISSRGRLLTLTVDGWCARLQEPDRYDWEVQGPVSARSVFAMLCERKGVPSYISEAVTTVDGLSEIMLGGNLRIDDGKLIFRGGESPLATFNRHIKPHGYRVYDTGTGAIKLSRVSGSPNTSPMVTFADGKHLLDGTRSYSVRTNVSYNDLNGPTYEDEFGGKVPIRSIPTEDVADPEIIGGHRYRKTTNSDLVRQDLADNARQVMEIDGGAQAPVRWKAAGVPGLSPGDVVAIADTTDLEADGIYWLMGIDWRIDESGYTATYRGWRGGRTALPSLVDRVVVPIQTAPTHLGDEYVGWYAVPSPYGTERVWSLTLPDKVSVANIRGYHHSTNSQLVDGVSTDLQVTKWAIWKAGTDRTNKDNKAESSGSMPRLPEDYELQHPYGAGLTWWSPFAVNLRSAEAGSYDLVLTCGDAEGKDDFEVQGVYAELFGTVEPALVQERQS